MPDLLVRGLSEETVRLLKARAEKSGRSLQAEVKDLVEWVAMGEARTGEVLAAEIRAKLAGWTADRCVEAIAEDRSR